MQCQGLKTERSYTCTPTVRLHSIDRDNFTSLYPNNNAIYGEIVYHNSLLGLITLLWVVQNNISVHKYFQWIQAILIPVHGVQQINKRCTLAILYST
jgi:hypothetical protein